ncbi:MAG: sporulation protein YjcZ [Bacillota bacterium]
MADKQCGFGGLFGGGDSSLLFFFLLLVILFCSPFFCGGYGY